MIYIDKILPDHDKLKHFYLGFLIFSLFWIFTPVWASILITAVIAGGKELIYDKMMEKGTAEFMDFFYSVIGGIIVGLIVIL